MIMVKEVSKRFISTSFLRGAALVALLYFGENVANRKEIDMAKKKTKEPAAKEVKKKKPGRPGLYRPEHNDLIYKLCLLGATDEEMADILGIARSTFSRWKATSKPLKDTIKRGKEIADAEVSESLYRRAKGYRYDEITQELRCDEESKERSIIVTKIVTKDIAPDTGAAMAWLKNRRPKDWRDKHEIEGTITVKKLEDVL